MGLKEEGIMLRTGKPDQVKDLRKEVSNGIISKRSRLVGQFYFSREAVSPVDGNGR
jgi:hypothetical protein